MDVSVFKVVDIREEIDVHTGGMEFVTRTFVIKDEDGSVHRVKIFADNKRNLTTSTFKENIHA